MGGREGGEWEGEGGGEGGEWEGEGEGEGEGGRVRKINKGSK